jgi:hypothetical protein
MTSQDVPGEILAMQPLKLSDAELNKRHIQCSKLAAYSITSLARIRMEGGIASPRDFADPGVENQLKLTFWLWQAGNEALAGIDNL